MEKDKIFFGENGLTQTSANFIANIAKEMYSNAEAKLNNIIFYTTTVSLVSTNIQQLIRKGVTDISDTPEILKSIGQLKALIAWLREGIKAKQRLIEEAEQASYSYFNIELPLCPVQESSITSDDYIASMSIKQRNRYYYLEAVCSTIGSYIHSSGTFSVERAQLNSILSNPNKVEGNGRDTLIYSRTPSIATEDVDAMYFNLQEIYRGYQAELNSIKYEIETAVNADALAKSQKYAIERAAYLEKMQVANAEMEAKRKEAVVAATALKIIIPDALKGIYEMVKNVKKN